MSERPPIRKEVGRTPEAWKFSELPYYYQCLGRACEVAGVLGEFYSSVDLGLDFGQALGSLRHVLAKSDKVEDVDEFLERFGITPDFD